MVKRQKNYKIRFLRMPPKSPRIWDLAIKFHPEFIMVMFLMMMHERFFAQIGGRHFHPSISVSPIFPQLLTIMSDTQEFPFFLRGHLLKMLACHGATLHLVRALCLPKFLINQKTNHMFMRLILGRVVSGITLYPVVVSCFEVCSKALLKYPLSVPQSPLRVEISDEDLIFELETIWQALSLCAVLPEAAQAVMEINIGSLSPFQKRTYAKLYMIIVFRRLFEKRNRVFLTVCNYYHLSELFRKQKRSFGSLSKLKEKYDRELQLLIESHDYEVYCYHLNYLLAVLQETHEGMPLLYASVVVLDSFLGEMRVSQHTHNSERDSDVSDLVGLSKLLQQDTKEVLLKMLNKDQRPPERETLCFEVSPPVHSFPYPLFRSLRNAYFLIIPPYLIGFIQNNRQMIFDKVNKLHSQWSHLIVLILNFAEWLQSDHPQRHFIFDCIAFMFQTRTKNHTGLARFLDLQKFQSKVLRGFHRLFELFRDFSHPSMECSDPTERTLLSFFKLIHMVFSNKRLLMMFQEFLKTLTEIPPRNFFSVWDSFLQELSEVPEFCPIIQKIRYSRVENCWNCDEFLDLVNDDGLCINCFNHAADGFSSEEEIKRFTTILWD